MAESYYQVITQAINDVSKRGYVSPEQISGWVFRISEAAQRRLGSPSAGAEKLRESLNSTFRRLVDQGSILKRHPGVPRDILNRVNGLLRLELSNRIIAAEDLISGNREAAIEDIIRKFKSWSTSIPSGGSPVNKLAIREKLKSLAFEDSQIRLDQTRKLESSISAIISHEGEALAGEWHSNWRLPNYSYREDHKERDLEIYPIRGTWGFQEGFMRRAGADFLDEIEQCGEWPYCRCWMKYFYSLSDLPEDFLTRKGLIHARAGN